MGWFRTLTAVNSTRTLRCSLATSVLKMPASQTCSDGPKITPGPHVDAKTVRWASRARWGELLQAGVEIHEYQPTMYHRKGLIIDERFVSVGSTKFDPRSFGLNDEANLNVYDVAFAEQQAASIDADLRHSRQVSYDEWKRRPLATRVWESMASVLGPLL